MSDSKDYRMQLIREIKCSLSTVMEPDQIQMVSNVITKVLSNYEVTERCTAIVPYCDENVRLLKQFAACLLIEGKSKGTVYNYVQICRRFGEQIGKPFTKVGVQDARYFIAREMERGISDSTRETYRSYLSTFFQWMTNEEIIPRNPLMALNPIAFQEPEKKPYTDVEIDAIRGACKNVRERAMAEVLISTGIRVQELADLELDDIDFHAMKVTIRHGKGNKRRLVYTTRLALKYLNEYLTKRDYIGTMVFPNRYGDKITTDGIRRVFIGIGEKAGVDNVHPHRFRITLASNLAARGMSVQDIQKILGHSQISTTMKYIVVDDRRTHAEYNKHIA